MYPLIKDKGHKKQEGFFYAQLVSYAKPLSFPSHTKEKITTRLILGTSLLGTLKDTNKGYRLREKYAKLFFFPSHRIQASKGQKKYAKEKIKGSHRILYPLLVKKVPRR